MSGWRPGRGTSGRTVQTSLGPTHLAATGAGSATVLWLPGTNFSAATSEVPARALGGRYRVWVADLPGQPGLSAATELGRDRIARYGPWVDEVVAEIGADGPLLLVGHSLGAAVALAATPSGRVAGAVLVGPSGLSRVRVTPSLLRVSVLWVARPTTDRAAALIRYMQHDASPLDPELVVWLDLVARHTRQGGAPGPLPADVVGRWRGRALVLTGVADRFFPANRLRAPALDRLDTTVEEIDGAGHLLPDEQPMAMADAIDRFLAALPDRS